jgi:hypothetical protein
MTKLRIAPDTTGLVEVARLTLVLYVPASISEDRVERVLRVIDQPERLAGMRERVEAAINCVHGMAHVAITLKD